MFVPSFPNITMEAFELISCDLFRNKFGEDLRYFIFNNYSRFLDDWESLLEENKINSNDLRRI